MWPNVTTLSRGWRFFYSLRCALNALSKSSWKISWKQRCERPRFGQSHFATFLHESTHPEKNMAALVTSTFTSTLHLPQANPKSKIPDTKLNSITENRKNQKTKKTKKKQKKNKDSRERLGDHSCWIFVFFVFPRLFFFGFPRFFQCFFGFGHFQPFAPFSGRSVSSCVQARRNQSFNHCSYEHTGSEDQDCVFQFWNVRPCDNDLSFMLYFWKNVA